MATKKTTAKKSAAKKKAAKKPVVVTEVQVYKSPGDGLWYWHGVAGNGKVVEDSAEGYTNRAYAFGVARDLHPGIPVTRG